MGRRSRRSRAAVASALAAHASAIPTGGPPTVHVHAGGALLHNPAASADAYKCEICMTVVQRRQDYAPGQECYGLDFYHEICAEILQSFVHWGSWVDVWFTQYGCLKVTPVGLAIVKPCPGHAACSWLTSPIDREPFCPADHTYQSPHTTFRPPNPEQREVIEHMDELLQQTRGAAGRAGGRDDASVAATTTTTTSGTTADSTDGTSAAATTTTTTSGTDTDSTDGTSAAATTTSGTDTDSTDAPDPSQAPSPACDKPLGSGTLWRKQVSDSASCSDPPTSKAPDVGCASDEDPTALIVDIGGPPAQKLSPEQKRSCFGWSLDACEIDILKVRQISFDMQMADCARTWAHPLWITPPDGRSGPTQHQSGEIDFVESCCGQVQASFGSRPEDSAPWTEFGAWPDDQDVRGAIVYNFDHADDVVQARFCDAASKTCKDGFKSDGYFRRLSTGRAKQGTGFRLVSDIWNGREGDAGFRGCSKGDLPGMSGCGTDYDNNCKFTVSNIQITSRDGKPLFGGACAALNAKPRPVEDEKLEDEDTDDDETEDDEREDEQTENSSDEDNTDDQTG